MIDQKKFSEALKEYRVRKGLTQHDLAKQLDMSRSVLSFLENGVQPPKTKHLTLIKDRLGISFDQIAEDNKNGVSEPKPYFGTPYDLPKDVAAIASMINDAKEAKKDLIVIMRLIDQVLANEEKNLTLNQMRILRAAKEKANQCLISL